MKKLIYLSFFICSLVAAQRFRYHTTTQSNGLSGRDLIPATQSGYSSRVRIYKSGNKRILEAKGLPNHNVGNFPNSGNPHSIEQQNYRFEIPLNPEKRSPTPVGMRLDVGVAINGVPFDPGAAEFYKGDPSSGWQYEALSGAITLGVDTNHAHVQPTGAYHYHGKPTGLFKKLGYQKGTLSPLIGWAADGFPIYASTMKINGQVKELKSSYRLKSGTRSIGGRYDGTFVQDYEYKKGSGDLDQCNGIFVITDDYPDGTYAYILTDSYPVIPRCLMGKADPSFYKKMGGRSQSGQSKRGQQQERGPRGGPPEEAIESCRGKSEGDQCSFRAPHGNISGICFSPPRMNSLACRPHHH